jgi:peptide/nickel transport system permease protein
MTAQDYLGHFWRGLVTIAGASLIVFLALRLAPGDPVELMLGEGSTAVSRAKLSHELGLDQPFSRQLAGYYAGLARIDLGRSLSRGAKPVRELIGRAIPNTCLLAICAALLANLAGVPAGAWLAYRSRSRAARAAYGASLLLLALPVFWLGPLLIVALSLRWPWLPVSGFDHWTGIVLPAVAVAVPLSAVIAHTTRAAVSEALHSDFIRTARAKGASDRRVLFRHALPASATPVVTVSALHLGHLLAGAVITETIFDWPGLGLLMYNAIMERDYPTVQGAALVIATMYVALNSATDLLVTRLSPDAQK